MPGEVRTRIDAHRLMKSSQMTRVNERVALTRQEIEKKKRADMQAWKRRAKVHVGIFIVTFIFTLGIFTLGILLWVRPGELLPLVLVSVVASLVFVATFTALRMFVLHVFLREYPNKEEDPGVQHHLAKSISYGFVALTLAIVLAGAVVNIVSASIL